MICFFCGHEINETEMINKHRLKINNDSATLRVLYICPNCDNTHTATFDYIRATEVKP